MDVLCSEAKKLIVLCARQTGKSLVCSALALRTMLLEEPALVLVVSPSDRQSGEFVKKVKDFYHGLAIPGLPRIRADSALQLHLANGSRLIGLPDSESRIRGYSEVRLLFLEEASRVPDDLYFACTPMLGASRGRAVALSTAWAKDGWFFDAWKKHTDWERFNITADQCPHFSSEFLAAERAGMPERIFLREYYNQFMDAVDSVFREEDIAALVDPSIQPLLSFG